jgi:hypothetical protein|tara:strand:+ start:8486 stop:9451 length:966 start_codon:yes stop_codon:yes gene_type:complete
MNFEMVTVRVGENSIDFAVHKDILFSVSRYFRRAWDRSFLGVRERIITLRDVSEGTFRTFLAWCYAQSLPGTTYADVLVPSEQYEATEIGVSGKSSVAKRRTAKRIFDEYVAGRSPYLRKMSPDEVDRRFDNNPSWHATYQEVVKSLIRLYIFANKYSIDQLRDDVMSTYMGYCITYGLYPDPDDVEAIELAYMNLPANATLSRYFVLSTIYFWSPAKHTLESRKLEGLHKRFILDVMVAQAQRGQPPNKSETKANKTVPQLARHGLKNSCVFHEHLAITEEACRCRLANSKFVFDVLLDGCAKEAEKNISMASRQRFGHG